MEDTRAVRVAAEHVVNVGLSDNLSEPSLQKLLQELVSVLSTFWSGQQKDSQAKEAKQACLCLLRIISYVIAVEYIAPLSIFLLIISAVYCTDCEGLGVMPKHPCH